MGEVAGGNGMDALWQQSKNFSMAASPPKMNSEVGANFPSCDVLLRNHRRNLGTGERVAKVSREGNSVASWAAAKTEKG